MRHFLLSALILAALPASPSSAYTGGMDLHIDAFANGASIPKQFTCDGGNSAPALRWSGEPANTKSFALIMDDPDAPAGTWIHWVQVDIPAGAHEIAGGKSGTNSFGKPGYGGPCPPKGNGPHRYYFRLYALDVPSLGLKAGAKREQVDNAMKGHILGQAEYMGRYERR